MKVGIYASYFGKDEPKAFPDVESFIVLAHELQLDVIDFRVDVGFGSLDRDYLRGLKKKPESRASHRLSRVRRAFRGDG